MFKKIVFMGTSNFAVPILKSLYQNGYPISVVYTQPPKKSNRGQKFNKSPINLFSENISLEIRTPNILKNNIEEEHYLNKLEPDLILVVSYGQIIPKNFLKIPKYGFLNIHASLLPKWRGAAPIQRSIMNLDKETGISVMKINENTELKLDLKTVIAVIIITASFVGMYFTLQSDIEEAKKLPPSEINRIEYDLKHEVIEDRLDKLDEMLEVMFQLGVELDKELHHLDAGYSSGIDSKIRDLEKKIKTQSNSKKKKRK